MLAVHVHVSPRLGVLHWHFRLWRHKSRGRGYGVRRIWMRDHQLPPVQPLFFLFFPLGLGLGFGSCWVGGGSGHAFFVFCDGPALGDAGGDCTALHFPFTFVTPVSSSWVGTRSTSPSSWLKMVSVHYRVKYRIGIEVVRIYWNKLCM